MEGAGKGLCSSQKRRRVCQEIQVLATCINVPTVHCRGKTKQQKLRTTSIMFNGTSEWEPADAQDKTVELNVAI